MYVTQCTHEECERHFQVNEFSGHALPERGIEHIVCPHCGTQYAGKDEYVYLTHSLSDKEEDGLKQVAR
jgi:hypothetical protein